MNKRPARLVWTSPAVGDAGVSHLTSAAGCEHKQASRGIGKDDARGTEYRPLALMKVHVVIVHLRRTGSSQATPAEGGTGPSHSSSYMFRTVGERPSGVVQTKLTEGGTGPTHSRSGCIASYGSVQTTLAEGGTGPSHVSSSCINVSRGLYVP